MISFVERVINDGIENLFISVAEKSLTLEKILLRTLASNDDTTTEARYCAIIALTATPITNSNISTQAQTMSCHNEDKFEAVRKLLIFKVYSGIVMLHQTCSAKNSIVINKSIHSFAFKYFNNLNIFLLQIIYNF